MMFMSIMSTLSKVYISLHFKSPTQRPKSFSLFSLIPERYTSHPARNIEAIISFKGKHN